MRPSIQNSEIFSDRLLSLRIASGYTQQELAKRLGVSKNYIYMLEAGRPPGPKLLQQVRLLEEEIAARERSKSESPSVTEDVSPSHSDTSSVCRYPSNCDLPERLTVMESDLKTIKTQMDTLMALLGGALRGGIEPKKKAG